MSAFIKTQIKLSAKEFLKYKPAKEYEYKLDKDLSPEENLALCEASYTRIQHETINLSNMIQEVKSAIQEWKDLAKKLPTKEEREAEATEFQNFYTNNISQFMEQMNIRLNEYKDIETELQATTKNCKSTVDRNERIEIRDYNKAATEAARATEHTEPTQLIRPAVALYQLPMLEIKPFKGDRRNWPSFKESFRTAIDSKPGNKAEKLNVLRSLLEGEPETLIAGMKLSDANYDAALKLLEDTYGETEAYIRTLHSELANLKKCNTLEETRKFMMELERLAREMKNAGEDIEGPSVYLQLEKKLNRYFLRTILNKKRETIANKENWNTTKFRKCLIEAVNDEAAIKEVMEEYGMERKPQSTSQSSQNQKRKNYRQNVMTESSKKVEK